MWRLEVEFQCFFEIRQRFSFGFTLAGDIKFKALRDVPVTLSPNARCKWTLHGSILSLDSHLGQLRSRLVAQCSASNRLKSARWHRRATRRPPTVGRLHARQPVAEVQSDRLLTCAAQKIQCATEPVENRRDLESIPHMRREFPHFPEAQFLIHMNCFAITGRHRQAHVAASVARQCLQGPAH